MRRLLKKFAMLVLCASALAPGLLAGPTAAPCTAPEFRQFDFWIGNWRVETGSGKFAGMNKIRPVLDGCELEEEWTGARGVHGRSFSMYDNRSKRWRQTYVDSRGLVLQLEGEFRDGKMVLFGESRNPSGQTVVDQITWTRVAPNRVRQLWMQSNDDGKSWNVVFDAVYLRRQ